MTDVPEEPGISRRKVLTTGAASAALGAGIGGAAVLAWSHPRGPGFWHQPDHYGAPPVAGVHLQFGKNAGTEVVVSWHTTEAVRNPRVMLGMTPSCSHPQTAPLSSLQGAGEIVAVLAQMALDNL